MEDQITVNIAFNISNPLHDIIIETSLAIRNDYGSDWFVDESRYHLHFPVYLFSAPAKNESLIIKKAQTYLSTLKKIPIKSQGLIDNQSGLLMVKFELSQRIKEMHEQAVEIFNPLRGNCLREKYKDYLLLSKLSSKDKEYLSRFGSQYVLDNYRPHITIARLKDDRNRREAMTKYRNRFINVKSNLVRLQIHKAIFKEGKSDKTILIYDEDLAEN